MSDKADPLLTLTGDQLQVLRSMAGSDTPNAARARTLLALAGGQGLAGAAAAGGLTQNQARYWLGRFRSQGLGAFAEDVVARHTAVPSLPRHHDPERLAAPAAAAQLSAPPTAAALTSGPPAAETPEQGKKKGGKKDKSPGAGKDQKKDKKSKKNKKSKKKKNKNGKNKKKTGKSGKNRKSKKKDKKKKK